jgi:Na+-transporting methylmalonyl-CoA/oxaloacetate decarboxylase gamma subunit
VLLVAGVAIVLVLLLVVTTIRSIMGGVRFIKTRVVDEGAKNTTDGATVVEEARAAFVTEQIAASAQELAQSAASLDELVKHFHLQ